MNKKQFFLGVLFSSVLGGVIAIGAYSFFTAGASQPGRSTEISIEEEQQSYTFTGNDIKEDVPAGLNFTEAAKVTTPAVVHVKMYKTVKQSNYYQDDLLRQFFGEPQRGYSNPQPEGPQHAGSGSGVILTKSGYIATNNHVVEGAEKVEVVLYDKRLYQATVVGTDPTTDLALLKIQAEDDLPFIAYGNSDEVSVGEWVLAVGNPFDLTSTVTAGIVSAKGRNINILRDKENLAIESFIQTDAAVNPGNSGGALVDLNGKLIGINTAIATPTGTYAGYSFAVPANLVKKVMEDLKDYGQVQRALLGVSIREVTAELKSEKGLSSLDGVYISDVREGSAAANANLQSGDIILEVNGTRVDSPSELQEAVALYRPGDEVEVTYLRDGSTEKVDLVLKNKLGNTAIVKREDKMVVTNLGAKMRALNEEEKMMHNVKYGVKVIELQEGKLKDSGIKKGYIITKINYTNVMSPDAVVPLLKSKDDGALIEAINNNGEKVYIGFGW